MNTIDVEIIDQDKKTATSKNGKPYEFIEVTYKKYFQGKAEVKGYKAMKPFSNDREGTAFYDALAKTSKGDSLTVVVEKTPEGYIRWVGFADKGEESVSNSTAAEGGSKAQQYAAQEDRRQTLIIRQSCLKAAVDYGIDEDYSVESIFELAGKFEDWVTRA